MDTETDIAARCQEFTDALTEILAENAIGPARRGRLARAHAAVKHHPEYSEHAFCVAVETAFMSGKPYKTWATNPAELAGNTVGRLHVRRPFSGFVLTRYAASHALPVKTKNDYSVARA